MVKKRLANGNACEKCVQTEQMLRRRNLWHEIDDVVWVIEGDEDSPGSVLARAHGVEVAPFFILASESGSESVYTSPLRMIRDHFPAAPKPAETSTGQQHDIAELQRRFARSEPEEILGWGLERYGGKCGIAFSGAEEVVLIDMASKIDLPFRVFTLDTGRLHPDTYILLDAVRSHYGIQIDTFLPDREELVEFVNAKGLNSFYRDGHAECCRIRKVVPMSRALAGLDAWVTGQRRDQSPATRGALEVVVEDGTFRGAGDRLLKLNPLANWTSDRVWSYIRKHGVPHNALHDRGYASVGCQPCTRPTRPDQHEREGRWWWVEEGAREWGIHVDADGI
jgi:phosphoadenosine phosphosulfate reductase